MIYQHPLAYLLGLEGIALLHAFAGDYDREFTQARLTEIKVLLESVGELGGGSGAEPITTEDGYLSWAESYDQPGNQLIDLEQPIVREILAGLDVGVVALDVACGTGRHTAYLASLGHSIIAVDSSPDMLAVARARVPAGEFHCADLHDLPVGESSVDVLVCALALMHVPDLDVAFAEFVRVLKPGGHLVISDWRGLIGVALPVVRIGPGGGPGFIPSRTRLTSEYLQAALPLGLQVRRCEEPRRPSPMVDRTGTPLGDSEPIARYVAGEVPDIWSLHRWCPVAANAAYRDTPAAIIWHFQLADE